MRQSSSIEFLQSGFEQRKRVDISFVGIESDRRLVVFEEEN